MYQRWLGKRVLMYIMKRLLLAPINLWITIFKKEFFSTGFLAFLLIPTGIYFASSTNWGEKFNEQNYLVTAINKQINIEKIVQQGTTSMQ